MRLISLIAVLLVAPAFAQESKAPALDATDRQLLNLAVQAQKLAQKACDVTPEMQHYTDTRKQIDAALKSRYKGYSFDWAKGVLVSEATAKP